QLRPKLVLHSESALPRLCKVLAPRRTKHFLMNKHERQNRRPAAPHSLAQEIEAELAEFPTEVIAIEDAPPLAPRAPLTKDEIRPIRARLLLACFPAAPAQPIAAPALPPIARQSHDVSTLSWVITAYLLASTAVAPVFGTLSDIYGRRAMIIVSLS